MTFIRHGRALAFSLQDLAELVALDTTADTVCTSPQILNKKIKYVRQNSEKLTLIIQDLERGKQAAPFETKNVVSCNLLNRMHIAFQNIHKTPPTDIALAKCSFFVHSVNMNILRDICPRGNCCPWCGALSFRLGFASLEEFVPAWGLRLDLFALGPKGELWIIECKSSRVVTSDSKWHNYLEGGSVFLGGGWQFPTDILPIDLD